MDRWIVRAIMLVAVLTVVTVRYFNDRDSKSALQLDRFSFSNSIVVPGSPEAVYDLATGDISPWWDHTFSKKPARFYIEAKPGGGFYEIFDDSGDGVLHGTVNYAHRGKLLRFTGPLGLQGHALTLVCTYEFEKQGADSTRMTLKVNASGEMEEGWPGVVENVWQHFLVERFKPYVNQELGQ